jgi:hypothetical protein
LIATTGQSWDQVRNEWDLPRLDAWASYCDKHPTLRAMVHAYLGIKTSGTQPPTNQPDIMDTLGMFPGAAERPYQRRMTADEYLKLH